MNIVNLFIYIFDFIHEFYSTYKSCMCFFYCTQHDYLYEFSRVIKYKINIDTDQFLYAINEHLYMEVFKNVIQNISPQNDVYIGCFHIFLVVQSSSHAQFFATPWTAACQACLSFTVSQSFLKLMSIESIMPSNHSSSVTIISSCPQSVPASGSFQMSWLFASGGQSISA